MSESIEGRMRDLYNLTQTGTASDVADAALRLAVMDVPENDRASDAACTFATAIHGIAHLVIQGDSPGRSYALLLPRIAELALRYIIVLGIVHEPA